MPIWLNAWAKHTNRPKQNYRVDEEDEGPSEGGDSPWLEEGRKWKAKESRLKYLELKGNLVRAENVSNIFGSIGDVLRGSFDGMCNECRDKAETALEQGSVVIENEFPLIDDPNDQETIEEDERFGATAEAYVKENAESGDC